MRIWMQGMRYLAKKKKKKSENTDESNEYADASSTQLNQSDDLFVSKTNSV